MQYYGTRLSENISRREPEGYLLCLNVPVARTGYQEYLPEELGLPATAAKPPEMISVYRPPEEVFSPSTIASFEDMPVTNNHPPDGVDIGNIRALQKGHARNIRRGVGEESDLLLADLIITDSTLIDLILHEGKREISCGYTYDLCEENGQYIQRQIRGNHVAVVDAGRAGPRVCIKDHVSTSNHERSHPMKKSLTSILARMAKDGDIETVAEILEAMSGAENPTADPATPAAATPVAAEPVAAAPAPTIAVPAAAEAIADPAAVIETPEGTTITMDSDTVAEIIARLDRLVELIGSIVEPAADEDPVAEEHPTADPAVEPDIVEEIVETVEETLEAVSTIPDDENAKEEEGVNPTEISEMVSAIIGEEEQEEDPAGDCNRGRTSCDELRVALKPHRHKLARMSPRKRRRVCADLTALMQYQNNGANNAGIYAAIRQAAKGQKEADPRELGRKIQAARNVNYRNKKNLI